MHNLLIICDNFPPQSGPRMGYLVKYLRRLGWKCWVVAAENPSRRDLVGLDGYAEEVHIISEVPHRRWNLLHMLPFFWPYDYLRGEYALRRVAFDLVKRIKFDLVLTSHTFGHLFTVTAEDVAKIVGAPLVIDIRDIAEQSLGKSFCQKSFSAKIDYLRSVCSFISYRRSSRVHHRAAAITTISKWHAEWCKSHFNPNSYCIFNGFDPELFKPVEPLKNDRFEIVYTGTLGTPIIRDYEPLVQAIQKLHVQGEIVPDRFKVRVYCGYIVPENPIRERVEELSIAEYFEFNEFIPLSDVPGVFACASCLLLLTAKTGPRGPFGTMTTKFFEYLAANRPILCVRSDEGCIEEAIRETNAGCAARTAEETAAYLRTLLEEWKQNGVTRGKTLSDKLKLYSREYQAKQFSDVFDSVLKKSRTLI